MCIALPQLGLGTAGTCRCAILIEEDLFDVFAENAGDLKGERKAWIVAARFDRVDASSRYRYSRCEFGLRPLHLRTKYSQTSLHYSSRSVIDLCQVAASTKPTVHRIIMLTGTPKIGTTGTCTPRLRRKSRARASVRELTNPNTSAR